MNSPITVVILAAGLGTRMKSSKAKVLHEAGGDTLLNHIIRAVKHITPVSNIVAVIGHQAQQVRDSVAFPGVQFAVQDKQKGTGHAVMCARHLIGQQPGQLLILNGDGPLLTVDTLQQLSRQWGDETAGGQIVTTLMNDPTGYGRIVRDMDGYVNEIVEEKSTTSDQRQIKEVNPGLYCFNAPLFWTYIDEIQPNSLTREYYLTDMVEILTRHRHLIRPLVIADETELLGINTKVELSIADRILRARKTNQLMLAGVTIESPPSVTIDVDVEIGRDTLIEANVQLRGKTRIGEGCRVGTGSVITNCQIHDNATILPYVVADQSTIGTGAFVGPFARLRLNAHAGAGSHIGNFVELKNTNLGDKAKANHLAYLGDATIGSASNIGAGTITCNYDGEKKHRTEIAEGVFVGSNSTLVAPLSLGSGSYIAAGSVITKNVDPDSLAIGRSHQVEKPNWAKRRRTKPQPAK